MRHYIKQVHKGRLTLSALCFFWLFVVGGCGYSMHGRSSLPFQEIEIGVIENKTIEPKLQDRLSVALTREFLKQGITVSPHAPYKLSGVIRVFAMHVLSEKAGIAAEYEIILKGDFKLTDPSGKISEFRNLGSPFIVSVSTSDSDRLNELIALKEQASERALADMSAEIVAALIYK
ncbi:MAG: LPS assembly lipoprotein LptE [Nitrospirota bacterium]